MPASPRVAEGGPVRICDSVLCRLDRLRVVGNPPTIPRGNEPPPDLTRICHKPTALF
jgi:hypothetical protein